MYKAKKMYVFLCIYIPLKYIFIQYLLQFECKTACTQRLEYHSTIWPPPHPS